MKKSLVWGSDLYKGFKLDKKTLLNGAIDDILPFQMLSMEEKTIDWIKAVADYYEVAGWYNVERKAGRIQKNYWLRYGKLNQSDYIVNPSSNEYYQAIGLITPPESQSPLEMFYPLAPTFVDMLRGEFIKRDNRWTIETIDPYSINEAFQEKATMFKETIYNIAATQKQEALYKMGLNPEANPEEFQAQYQKLMSEFEEIEYKLKTFRTTGAKWAEKVINIHDKRYNLQEIEPDGFECGLITDSEFYHIDMYDDDFKLELLNPKYCDFHKGPNTKYVSNGDYFVWFDFMSAGDIVNKFGRKMKESELKKLKEVYVKTSNIIVTDDRKGRQGEYYDGTKPWHEATDLNPTWNDALLGKELAYSFMRTPNFEHNMEVDILNPIFGRHVTGKPQMFRVMRLYWRALRRIGWLTRIRRDGTIDTPMWVDETYEVTEKPVYDKSIIKDETKNNLIYGEHIDWTWAPEWRHVMKISPNQKHTFWMNTQNSIESIYIDGAPIPFQFKGINNPFDCLPPIEGAQYSYINTNSNGFIDRIKGYQIIYNICMNKVPRKILEDKGLKVAIDRRMMQNVNGSNTVANLDPVSAYEDKLAESSIFDYTLSKETLDGLGMPPLPQVLNLSTVQEAQFYLELADRIKWIAGETIGITRQRLGAQKASETATGIQQGIIYSETQTEKYYEQHSNLMERVRQRMLDATQYYATINDNTRDMYMNDMDENIFLETVGLEQMLTQFNIRLQSKANVRAALQTIAGYLQQDNTLPIKPSDKIQAIVESSVPKILHLLKQGELEMEKMQRDQQMQQQQMQQQELQVKQQMEKQKLAFEADQKEKDRQNQKDIAIIRAMGGLQSDNNQDGEIDAKTNMDFLMKEREMSQKYETSQADISSKEKLQMLKNQNDLEKSRLDIEKEKIKQKGALDVAKENKQKGEK
jgi:hypothetical protein